jgi:stearoyl-CoA desaturase (Delta-9 desaturase)
MMSGMQASSVRPENERFHLLRMSPFIIVHLLPLAAIYTGASAIDWLVCFGLYYVRMFGVTGGYHRYFSHRTYKTSRVMQFCLAFLAQSSAQKGALWWAANHRHHHKFSDMEDDIHSPLQRGFWWSHVGWMLVQKHDTTQWDRIKDFAKYPELVWLNKNWWVPPTTLGVAVFLIGGWPMLLIGFFLSTVLLWHGTFIINSLCHVFGSRRFKTTDTSRNNLLFALLTCGEGWHNNHHHFCASANQGFYWWEIDVSFYVIRFMQALGLVWDVRTPPKSVLERNRVKPLKAKVVLPSLADAE